MVLNFDSQTDCDKALKNINDQTNILGLQASEIKVRRRLLVKNLPATFSKEKILATAIQRNENLSNLLKDNVSKIRIGNLPKNHNRPDIQ